VDWIAQATASAANGKIPRIMFSPPGFLVALSHRFGEFKASPRCRCTPGRSAVAASARISNKKNVAQIIRRSALPSP
jgi:hypothetical protein